MPNPKSYIQKIEHLDDRSRALIEQADGTQHLLTCFGKGKISGRLESIEAMAADTVREVFSKGVGLRRVDGAAVFRERRPILDLNAETSRGRYTWHEDGNRIRARWVEIVEHEDGRIEERELRKVWIRF